MKFRTLPVKRRPVSKGVFHRMSAVTRNRKQRAAAAAPAAELEADGGSKIARALTIIFLIHIVALAMIFVHQRFLEERPAEQAEAGPTSVEARDAAAMVVPAPAVRRDNLPQLASGDALYPVRQGDNYAKIAASVGVTESELRDFNGNVDIESGLLLKLPAKRIVAVEAPEVTAIREQTPPDQDRGLVEAVPVNGAPRATLVRPAATAAAGPATEAAAAGGESYVVRKGDSIWRIANRFKVSQDQLMQLNGISDPRRMKAGMTLVIPK